MLDTCILDQLYNYGEFVWDGHWHEKANGEFPSEDLIALRNIFAVNERAMFQFVISPLTITEVANIQGFSKREGQLGWVLGVLDHWLIVLDEISDRASEGGAVRHRFKLSLELQEFEAELLTNSDFRRDPIDRLMLVQYKMADCDAFMTIDRNTIWKYRQWLSSHGVRVITPSEFWSELKPFAALWL